MFKTGDVVTIVEPSCFGDHEVLEPTNIVICLEDEVNGLIPKAFVLKGLTHEIVQVLSATLRPIAQVTIDEMTGVSMGKQPKR